MASALCFFDILTAVHIKLFCPRRWQAFINNSSADGKTWRWFLPVRLMQFRKTKQILDLNPALNFVCIDVANVVIRTLRAVRCEAREAVRPKPFIAGNVVTGEMCEELILSGADIVKGSWHWPRFCLYNSRQNRRPVTSAAFCGNPDIADAAHGLEPGMIVSGGGCARQRAMWRKPLAAKCRFRHAWRHAGEGHEGGGRIVEENGEKFMLCSTA